MVEIRFLGHLMVREMDPGMWLNMVNVKPPYLVDLVIESMKNLFWSISVTLINVLVNFRSMQQFVLEEHLEIMCKSGEEMEEFMLLAQDDLISAILHTHAANSSRKWRLLIKMRKWTNLTSLCRLMSNM